jgi:hypothetical protein
VTSSKDCSSWSLDRARWHPERLGPLAKFNPDGEQRCGAQGHGELAVRKALSYRILTEEYRKTLRRTGREGLN